MKKWLLSLLLVGCGSNVAVTPQPEQRYVLDARCSSGIGGCYVASIPCSQHPISWTDFRTYCNLNEIKADWQDQAGSTTTYHYGEEYPHPSP